MGLKSREKGRCTLAIISRGMFAPCQHISSLYQLSPLQQLVYRNGTTAQENAVKGSINLIGENNSKYFLLLSSAASPPIELQWAGFTLNSFRLEIARGLEGGENVLLKKSTGFLKQICREIITPIHNVMSSTSPNFKNLKKTISNSSFFPTKENGISHKAKGQYLAATLKNTPQVTRLNPTIKRILYHFLSRENPEGENFLSLGPDIILPLFSVLQRMA
ncbi:hypothetical protein CDAR_97031 [Caerostris darwini]|uniref:Uncharacterized protein n=1 Tax=Caerostris darwini TaxID=1538125 RepID=A0AAV4QMM6_9ARAC|nr:hypothetical protein CDAR_97031 [Caerostris darwini]